MQITHSSRVIPIAASISLILVFAKVSFAQEWRGIKILKSTCEDVKRGLGIDKCEYPRSVFRLKEETVTISFEMCPCPIRCYHQSGGWNVPPGTVGSIVRQLRVPLPLSNFSIDAQWTAITTDLIGQVIYRSKEQGIELSVIDRKVVTVTYYPSLEKTNNKDLVCPPCTVRPSAGADKNERSSWFSTYGKVDLAEEEKRLDTFADKIKANGKTSRGYIVTYDSCRERGEAAVFAERAKKHLLDIRGIAGNRIIIIDGGQREEMTIELHVRPRRLPPPRILSSTYPKVP